MRSSHTPTLILCALLCAATPHSHAQVIKCSNPATGKVIYSDRPCEATATAVLLSQKPSAEQVWRERERAAEATERFLLEQQAQNERAQQEARSPSQQGAARIYAPAAKSADCERAEYNYSVQSVTSPSSRSKEADAVLRHCGYSAQPALPSRSQAGARGGAPVSAPHATRVITHCDTGFCYDNQGGVHHKVGPSVLLNPDGKTCHVAGGICH